MAFSYGLCPIHNCEQTCEFTFPHLFWPANKNSWCGLHTMINRRPPMTSYIDKTTLVMEWCIGRGLHTLLNWCWCGLSVWVMDCQHRSVILNRGHQASSLSCTQWFVNTWICLPVPPLASTQWCIDIRRVLPVPPLDCTKWLANIRHSLPTSPLTCTQQSVDVGYRLLESSIAQTSVCRNLT